MRVIESCLRRTGAVSAVLAVCCILAACQTIAPSAVSGGDSRPFATLGGKQIPLPRNGDATWRTAVERHYKTQRGTAMSDAILIQTAGQRVHAIVWITTNDTPQAQGAGWQLASFCRPGSPRAAKVIVDTPNGRQDCWAVDATDAAFQETSNASIRALGAFLDRNNLSLDPTIATASFHYATPADLLDITYGFAVQPPGGTARRHGEPRSSSEADMRHWAQGMHLQVRLGFHRLLDQDSIPAPAVRDARYANRDKERQPSPTREGIASPQPQARLSDIDGLAGDVPENNRATIDLLAANFDHQVFQTEFGGPYPWLRKWSRDPVIRISSAFSDEGRAAIERTARQLHAITGLDFTTTAISKTSTVDPRAVVNEGSITFLLSNGDGGPGSCHGIFTSALDGSIVAAVIFVSPEFHGAFLEECVVEELAQVMGPLNDTTFIAQSIFNDQTNGITSWLTWNDAVVLRTLYDERLRPGMPRDHAMPLARQIIEAHVADLN